MLVDAPLTFTRRPHAPTPPPSSLPSSLHCVVYDDDGESERIDLLQVRAVDVWMCSWEQSAVMPGS